MKRIGKLLIVVAAVALFGCNAQRIQILETKSTGTTVAYKADVEEEYDLKSAEKLNLINKLEYPVSENADVRITYTFWGKGGKMTFKLFNKTDKVIYVDFRESRFIKNGQNIDYYTENAFTIEYAEGKKAGGCGSLFSKTTIKKVDVGVNKKYDRILAVAPKSYIIFNTQFNLMDVRFNPICGFSIPMLDKSISREFTRTNSPLVFRNFLTYSAAKSSSSVGGDLNTPKVIDDEFYVSKITNMKIKPYKGEKLKVKRCDMTTQLNKYQLMHLGKSKLNNYITNTYPYDKPSNFYFNYLQTKKK